MSSRTSYCSTEKKNGKWQLLFVCCKQKGKSKISGCSLQTETEKEVGFPPLWANDKK
jgi:hypothetical protein